MSRWNADSGSLPLFVHVAVGVFIGSVAAAFVVWRFGVWRLEHDTAEVANVIQQRVAEAAESSRQSALLAEQREAARRIELAKVQRAQEDAKRRSLEEQDRREMAWARYYKKPAVCEESRGGSWSVDCANDYIRARKRFSELYEAGKL